MFRAFTGAARRAGGGRTVPVLVTPGGAVGESDEILAWVDRRTAAEQRLFPADRDARAEVGRLCSRFDEVLGPTGRRLVYVHVLPQRDLLLSVNNFCAEPPGGLTSRRSRLMALPREVEPGEA
jgi:glutathione S-transferase